MTPCKPDIKAIFTAALEHSTGPEREAWLVAACGDDAELRRRIEDLLVAYSQASDVLGPSGPSAMETSADASTAAGCRDNWRPRETARGNDRVKITQIGALTPFRGRLWPCKLSG
jgi:hypothetical protein